MGKMMQNQSKSEGMAWNGYVTIRIPYIDLLISSLDLISILYTSPGLHFSPQALVKPGLLIGRGTSSGQAADFIRRGSSGDGISISHMLFKFSWVLVSVLTLKMPKSVNHGQSVLRCPALFVWFMAKSC